MKLFILLALISTVAFAGAVRNQINTQEYIYDFSVHGGAVGTKTLTGPTLPVGAIVTDVTLKVVTAFASATSGAVAWGTAADVDGFYAASTLSYTSLVDNYLNDGVSGALITEAQGTTPEVYLPKPYLVSSGNGQIPVLEISSAALTAGKALVIVEYYMPTID